MSDNNVNKSFEINQVQSKVDKKYSPSSLRGPTNTKSENNNTNKKPTK
jgi:hypothetical protein